MFPQTGTPALQKKEFHSSPCPILVLPVSLSLEERSLFPESCESLHIFSLKALSSFSGAQGALNTPPQRRLFSIVLGDIYSSASELRLHSGLWGRNQDPTCVRAMQCPSVFQGLTAFVRVTTQ